MARRLRVNVVQHGERRCLFSVVDKDTSNGDLTIAVRARSLMRTLGFKVPLALAAKAPRQDLVRISLHRSLNSASDINVFKVTRKIAGRPVESYVVNTRAIKQFKRFDPVLGWRCSNLEGPAWTPKPEKEIFDIPNDPRYFTLCLSLFAGPADIAFSHLRRSKDDFNWRQLRFSNFSLTLVWSYIGLRAHDTACMDLMESLPGLPSPGMKPAQCIKWHKASRERWREDMVRTVKQFTDEENPETRVIPLLNLSTFFKSPSIKTNQYQAWLNKLVPHFVDQT